MDRLESFPWAGRQQTANRVAVGARCSDGKVDGVDQRVQARTGVGAVGAVHDEGERVKVDSSPPAEIRPDAIPNEMAANIIPRLMEGQVGDLPEVERGLNLRLPGGKLKEVEREGDVRGQPELPAWFASMRPDASGFGLTGLAQKSLSRLAFERMTTSW